GPARARNGPRLRLRPQFEPRLHVHALWRAVRSHEVVGRQGHLREWVRPIRRLVAAVRLREVTAQRGRSTPVMPWRFWSPCALAEMGCDKPAPRRPQLAPDASVEPPQTQHAPDATAQPAPASAPDAGASEVVVLAANQDGPTSLVIERDHLCWVNQGIGDAD